MEPTRYVSPALESKSFNQLPGSLWLPTFQKDDEGDNVGIYIDTKVSHVYHDWEYVLFSTRKPCWAYLSIQIIVLTLLNPSAYIALRVNRFLAT